MKHFISFETTLKETMTYTDYIDEAVKELNISSKAARLEKDSTHVEERQAIINYISNKFDKSEEDVVTTIIEHSNIQASAVEDYMYYYYRDHGFPSNKAVVLPDNMPVVVRKYGFHVAALIEGNLVKGVSAKITSKQIEPAMVFSYYNKQVQDWVSFRVNDSDVYGMTKSFKSTCTRNKLPIIDGRGKKDEFTPLVEYIRNYIEENNNKIEVKKQYDRIGWNETKTEFTNPRDKTADIMTSDTKLQRSIDYGYISKGDDPTKNVNQVLSALKAHPLAVAVYAASFINPIIDGAVLDVNCITIDIFGPKGKGKNLLQYAAMNPMGSSDRKSPLMHSLSRSSIPGINSVVRFHNSHVVCYEESHRASVDVLEDIIYSVFNSTTGNKANVDGTSRDDGRYSSIIIASGESSIAKKVKNEGLMRRILPMDIRNVLSSIINDPVLLEEFHVSLGDALMDSYGIALDPFLAYVIENKEQVKNSFKSYRNKYKMKDAPSLFDYEKYKTFEEYTACVHLVLELLIEALNISVVNEEDINQICSKINDYCVELCTTENKNIEALADVYAFAVENKEKHFVGNNKNQAQYGKFDVRNIDGEPERCLYITNKRLNEILNDKGYTVENTIEAWKSENVLYNEMKNGGHNQLKKSYSFQATLSGERVSCSILIISKIEKLVGLLDDSIKDSENGCETLYESSNKVIEMLNRSSSV